MPNFGKGYCPTCGGREPNKLDGHGPPCRCAKYVVAKETAADRALGAYAAGHGDGLYNPAYDQVARPGTRKRD